MNQETPQKSGRNQKIVNKTCNQVIIDLMKKYVKPNGITIFGIGTLFILLSTFGLIFYLPYVNAKISEVDTHIENKTNILHAIEYNLERSSDTLDTAEIDRNTIIILKEINATQNTVNGVYSDLKTIRCMAIVSKYSLLDIKESNEVLCTDKSIEELVNIDRDYTSKLMKKYYIVLEEKNSLLGKNAKLVSDRNFWQIILGLANGFGLFLIFIVDLTEKSDQMLQWGVRDR